MKNVLYIHGFGSNHNAGTFLELKEQFPEYNFFSDDFDLLDVSGTLKKIQFLCAQNKIDIIIGKSLGGFYTLAHEGNQRKIVINPCSKPWIEIPKLDNSISGEILSEWQQLFEKTQTNIDTEKKEICFGIFGDHDHLFSYKNLFDELYKPVWVSLQKSFLISGDHHIQIENLKPAVEKAFEYFDMMEEYHYVFELMPFYQLIKDDDEKKYLPELDEEQRERIIDSVDHYHNRMVSYQNKKID